MGLETCARREFITSHAAFGYLARHYRLEQIAISGLSPEAEPSPARIAEVQDEAREHRITTIFYETLVSPAVAESIAGDLGLRTDVLDPIEGITDQSRGIGLRRRHAVQPRGPAEGQRMPLTQYGSHDRRTNEEVVLAAADLSVELGGLPVLRGITVSVHAGEAVALLGGNGSGKSTLVRAVLGLVPVQRGTVELFGTPRPDLPELVADRLHAAAVGRRAQRSEGEGSGGRRSPVPAAALRPAAVGRPRRGGARPGLRRSDRAGRRPALGAVGRAAAAGAAGPGAGRRAGAAGAGRTDRRGRPGLADRADRHPDRSGPQRHRAGRRAARGGFAGRPAGPRRGAAGGPGRLRRSARRPRPRRSNIGTIPRCSSRAGWTGRSNDDRAAQLSLHAPRPGGRTAHRADRPGHRHLHRAAAAEPARRRSGPCRHRRRRPGPAHRPGADPGRRRCLRGRRGRGRGASAARQGDRGRRSGHSVLRRPGGGRADVGDRRPGRRGAWPSTCSGR